MKTLKEILEGIIADVKQMEFKPEEKRYLYDHVTDKICSILEAQTGYGCSNPYQKGNASEREIIIKNKNRIEKSIFVEVKLTKGETKHTFMYSTTYYSVKDIFLSDRNWNLDKSIDGIFADIEQKENEQLKEVANELPKTIEKFNVFITDIQTKMNNYEAVEGWRIEYDFKKLIESYNESLKASKTV